MPKLGYWNFRRNVFLVSLWIFGIQVPLLLAQVASSGLNGVVTDATGAVIPKTQVTVTSEATGFSRTTFTNETGSYSIPNLTPGLYDISAEVAGFKKGVVKGIRLFVGQTATADIRLEVGAVTEAVSVTAAAPLLHETTSEVGTIIEGKVLTEIPLNGRNFLQLNLLSPGAIRSKNSNTFDDVQINPTAQSFNVNGQRGDYNLYLLDGTTIKEYQHGSNTFSPSVDAVQEFQVATSNYSAAFGSEAGAQVNLVTKSGTNEVHGGFYEFLRNNKLDARNFFAQTHGAPPFKRNQFGGTLGGPIFIPKVYKGRDKTFFFTSYEGFREVKEIPQQGNFPTPTQLGGDLSDLVTPGQPLIDPFSGSPFPGNVIPEDRIPSTLLTFLRNGIGNGPWIPAPNSTVPGFNYFRDDARRFRNDQVMVRVDHRLSDKTFIYGRYAFNDANLKNPNLNPNWFFSQFNRAHSIAFHLTKSVSPNFLGEFSFGFSKFSQADVQSTAFKDDITNKILQIKGLSTFPDSWGAPVFGVAGFDNLGEVHFGPRRWKPDIFEFRPAFSFNKGRHNMKWGMDIQRYLDTFQEIFATYGSYYFDGRFSGYPLGDFLLGLPASDFISTSPFDPLQRYSALMPYFQDDWKVTSNLTLNLGLRYEWRGVPFSANRSISNLYFPPNNAPPQLVVSDGAEPITFEGQKQTFFTAIPFVPASKVGLPQPLVFNDNNNLGPRVGFAFSLPGVPRTVLRGGYGTFYQPDIEDKWVESSVNPPFVKTLNVVLDQTNFRKFDWYNPGAGAFAAAAQLFANDTHMRAGVLQAWHLSMEHTVWDTLFSASYVGNNVHHLSSFTAPNQARPGSGSIESRQRWPGAGTLFLAGYDGTSSYHSGQFKVQRPFAKGLTLLLGYTWSKAIDDAGGTFVGEGERGSSFQDSYNRKADRGLAAQDARHRFVLSYVYELPFGRGKPFLNRSGLPSVLLGGWQVNGIITFQSGSPFTVDQVNNCANTDVTDHRPDLVGNPNGLSKSRTTGDQVDMFFDTSAFRDVCPDGPDVGPFRFGNAGRHIVIGPGVNNWDFAVYKDFHLTEAKRIQFRSEYFNLFNHPIFRQPGRTLGTDQFGRISATALDSREIQFALKFYF